MKEVEFCLHAAKKPVLRFRMPAAYITGETRDSAGRLGYVWLEAWLPDLKPSAAIPELGANVSYEERARYLQANRHKLLRLNVGGERAPDDVRKQHVRIRTDQQERIFPDQHGLAHFTRRRCESLINLIRQGRAIESRKCEEEKSTHHEFHGLEGLALLFCRDADNLCEVQSTFHEYGLSYPIHKSEIARWEEYDKAAKQFLDRHLVAQ